jgi:hypothetical protein
MTTVTKNDDSIVISADSQSDIEAEVLRQQALGVKFTGQPQLIGRKWMIAGISDVAQRTEQVNIKKIGLHYFITGPTEDTVTKKYNELLIHNGKSIREPYATLDGWVAVIDVIGQDFRW